MDDRGAALFGLHYPTETHRMTLRHIGALDDDAVCILQVLLKGGRASAAKRCPQTGNGRGVSNTGLVLDLNDAERIEEFLDEIVLFVVEGGTTEVRDGHRAANFQPIFGGLFPVAVTGILDPLSHHVHRLLPRNTVRAAVQNVMLSLGACHQLERGCSLRTEAAVRDWRARVAFNVDDFIVLYVDQLSATDSTIGAYRRDYLVSGHRAGRQAFGPRRACTLPKSYDIAIPDLFPYRPDWNTIWFVAHILIVAFQSRLVRALLQYVCRK